MSLRRFASWLLGFNVLVVLWGALVRATGSGAGCGSHWPLCNGVVVPRSPAAETLIELTHRITSGLSLVLVATMVVWAFRALPRGHAGRKAAVASGIFIVTEALLGAALVLFGWVAGDTSTARGWVVAGHLVNTFFLLGAIALTAQLAGQGGTLTARGRSPLVAALGLALASVLGSAATGAVAALGDTLYPATTLSQGLLQDLNAETPMLLRLRLVHPLAALSAALVLVVLARAVLQTREPRFRSPGLRLLMLLAAQLVAGGLSLVLLAPIWLQLVHLALAQLIWIVLVTLAGLAFSGAPEGVDARAGRPSLV